MSLVGPRPELPVYTAQYTADEKDILSVRPGITDLSSIRFSSLDEIVGGHEADRIYEKRCCRRKTGYACTMSGPVVLVAILKYYS